MFITSDRRPKKVACRPQVKPVFLYRNVINHILSEDLVRPNKSCPCSEHGLGVNVWAVLGFADGIVGFCLFDVMHRKPTRFIAPISFRIEIINSKSVVNGRDCLCVNFIDIKNWPASYVLIACSSSTNVAHPIATRKIQ